MPLSDRDSFAELIVRHQHRVFAYIATLVPNRDDAEDVFQSTCLLLWKKWDEFDPARDFFAWACGFAHNEVRNMLRRGSRERLRLSDDVLSQVGETRLKANSLFENRGQYLGVCIEKLSQLQRQLVEDCYLGDRPIKAIAEELGVSPAAVTMRLQRIRRLLFECMNAAVSQEERRPS
jgi:RNA polymerase sigma-70 factor, ECF subfamily